MSASRGRKRLARLYSLRYYAAVTPDPKKKVIAEFFKTDSGNEPVRDALHALGKPTKTVVGEDVRFVEFNWRVDRPYVDRLRSGKGEFERSITRCVTVSASWSFAPCSSFTEVEWCWSISFKRRVEPRRFPRSQWPGIE